MVSQTDDDSSREVNAIARREYDRLPEAIKFSYGFDDWLWLSNEQKRNLIQDETEPEAL